MLQIKKYREAAGLTKTELADLMGVRPPAVSKWESGGNVTLENLAKLADILEVSVDALLGRTTA